MGYVPLGLASAAWGSCNPRGAPKLNKLERCHLVPSLRRCLGSERCALLESFFVSCPGRDGDGPRGCMIPKPLGPGPVACTPFAFISDYALDPPCLII